MRSAREASSSSDGTQRVSLKDIADELGISQTAVSFAINDRPGVSAETKRRVKEAAARLGWTPVYAAQALGSSKTMTIGFAPARSAQGLTDETFMLHFMAGVHTSLSPKGYGLLYRPCRSLNEEMSVYRDWASRKRVDGVILVDLRADDPRPKLLKELGVRAVLAGGCFWGMQDLIRKLPGVTSTRVGYTGGDVDHATYRNHGTHAEGIEIIFDPARISYRKLLEFFFQIHDPTTLNRQGNDRGTSYRSGIYYTSEAQKKVAEDTILDVEASGLWPGSVKTELKPAGDFWEAEPEHQDYLERIPNGYTCHFVRPNWVLPKRSAAE